MTQFISRVLKIIPALRWGNDTSQRSECSLLCLRVLKIIPALRWGLDQYIIMRRQMGYNVLLCVLIGRAVSSIKHQNPQKLIGTHHPHQNSPSPRVLKIIPALRLCSGGLRQRYIYPSFRGGVSEKCEVCSHAPYSDVGIYRCFRTLWVAVESISKGKHKGRLPQNCTETEWVSAR